MLTGSDIKISRSSKLLEITSF